MLPQPGEIWLADLGMVAKTRPLIIVSRHDEDAPRAVCLYVPLTSQDRESSYEIPIPPLSFLREKSVANTQGLGSLGLNRLERKLGVVPADIWQQVQQALRFALDLP